MSDKDSLANYVRMDASFSVEAIDEALAAGEEHDWREVLQSLINGYATRRGDNLYSRNTADAPFFEDYSDNPNWLDAFRKVIGKPGPVDGLWLHIPMQRTSTSRYVPNHKASAFWHDADAAVYKELAAVDVDFLPDNPLSVFVWCSADVAKVVFEIKGWSFDDLSVDG